VTPQTLRRLLEAQTSGPAIVLATRLPDGEQLLLPDDPSPPGLQDAASLALARDENRIAEVAGGRWFLQVHAPPYRLVIVGAVHVAQALAGLAGALGYGVTIVDPRRSFATAERFPGVTLAHGWPDEALDALAPDGRTAVVTLTHDPKLDDPALDRALRSHAFYIGALGSRKTHAGRLERLAALGHAAASMARIRGPVGLALGAVSAPEIALSILAEIVAVRRGAAIARRE
jgi:xanthine dehydrogenase accessory factor